MPNFGDNNKILKPVRTASTGRSDKIFYRVWFSNSLAIFETFVKIGEILFLLALQSEELYSTQWNCSRDMTLPSSTP